MRGQSAFIELVQAAHCQIHDL